MEIKEAIEYALDGDAILFLGSGHSYGAKNKNGNPLKTGDELAKYLYQMVGFNTDNTNLSDAVEMYQDEMSEQGFDSDNMLIDLLKSEYMVKSIAPYHKHLPYVPWKRIYTTNYDNVVEISYEQSSKIIHSISMSANPSINKKDICLHINGYIKDLNKRYLNSDFKLTDKSYNTNALMDNLWGNLFKYDIKTSRAIIFVGFSCRYDLDIRRIIANLPVKDKIIFITSPNEDEVNMRYLNKYGTAYNLGVEKFYEMLADIKDSYIPIQEKNIDNVFFTNFDRYTFELPFQKASDFDVLNYYSRGIRKNELYYEKVNNTYYSVLNRKYVDNIKHDIEQGVRIIFIHSDIGNGKTEIIEQIKRKVNDAYRIFSLSDNNSELNNEVEILCNSQEKILVVIENYFNYKDVFQLFQTYGDNNIVYIFSSRTSIFKTTFENFTDYNISENEIAVYDVNRLDDEECVRLVDIFNEYGYYLKNGEDTLSVIKKRCQKKFQNIVLELFESNNVSKEFEYVLKLIKGQDSGNGNNDTYLFVLFTILIKLMALEVDFFDLINLYNSSVQYGFEKDMAVNELIDFHDHNIKIKSSVIALWLIRQKNLLADIIKTLIDIAKKADKYQLVNKKYQRLLGTIISYKHLKFISSQYSYINSKDLLNIMNKFYEEVKNLSYYKDKYFFWLQYAISSLEMGDLEGAEMHFNAAYNKLPNGMTPFEINNHYARLEFEKILQEKYDLQDFNRVIDNIERLLTPTMHEDDDEFYCFKMASSYYPLVFKKLYAKLDHDTQSRLIDISISYYKRCYEFKKRCRVDNFKQAADGFLHEFLTLRDYESQNWIEAEVECKKDNFLILSLITTEEKKKAFVHKNQMHENINNYHIGNRVLVILDTYNDKHNRWNIKNITKRDVNI